ncbi:MAG: P-loop NTPase [Bdellovibrionales bacterium]|nr:P-loop NTPase [Bdellovibrionales bacterium]
MNRIDQQILFISGKGGVGKSTVAASLALRLSQSGKKVLLVELNEQSHFQILLEEPFTYSPVEWRPNLWVSCWNGEACLREYFKHYVRIETLVDLFFKNVVMRTFIQAAPLSERYPFWVKQPAELEASVQPLSTTSSLLMPLRQDTFVPS